MSSSAIFAVQQNVARYGLSTLLVLGNFGNLFTIIILARTSKQKVNSCSLYLLAASISNWIVINTALVSNIVGVDHIDPQNTSNIICKLRWSGVHALLMLSRSFSKLISETYIFIFDYLYSDCWLYRSMGSLFTKPPYSIFFSTIYSCSYNRNSACCLDNYTHSFSYLFQ
jgi:hypothetical protein